ncbi:MAG: putative Zn-dependent protease, partial [Myxococcota bacterium]
MRQRRVTGTMVTCALLVAIGCGSAESRVGYHNERGDDFLEASNIKAAKIEYRAALSFDPRDPYANLKLADLAEVEGNLHDAEFYLREVIATDPNNSQIAVRLATLLRDDEPWRARQLLMSIIKQYPDDATAHLALSQHELSIWQTGPALAEAKRAIELDPSVPGAYWQLGIIYEAMIKQATNANEPITPALREQSAEAFEDFVASGGTPVWKARLEQARVMSSGAHNAADALDAARRAVESAKESAHDDAKLLTATHLATVARTQKHRAAYADAIEVILEVHPRDFRAWRNLADLRGASGGSAEEVYADLLALYPHDPEAHNLYAKHIGSSKGVWAAIRYYNQVVADGIAPAQMLSALRSYQLIYRLATHAEKTLARLENEHPDDPWTALEHARNLAAGGYSKEAIEALEILTQSSELFEVFEVLAKLQQFHQRPTQALTNARRAAKIRGYFEPRVQRLIAELYFETGQFQEHLDTVEVLDQHEDLPVDQQLRKAQSLYATGQSDDGRALLLSLINDPEVGVEATLEFARREASNSRQRHRARSLVEAAAQANPDNRDLLMARIDLNIKFGRADLALELLNGLAIQDYSAGVRFLRSYLKAEAGDFTGALGDLNLALRGDPSLPGLIDFALVLYSRDNNFPVHISTITAFSRDQRKSPSTDWLTNSRKLANLHLLASRLHHASGNNLAAIAVLDQAVNLLEFTSDVRVDLAYLLALTAMDPKRAIEIASEVVGGQPNNPRALDALGLAFLTADKPYDALRNFKLANRNVESPTALYLFHESTALGKLGRERDAIEAIDSVLAIEPNYPEAKAARSALLAAIAEAPKAS